MALASREQKSELLATLKSTSKKYTKPFEQGKMAGFSIMGGNWEEDAAIITATTGWSPVRPIGGV